MIAVDPRSEMLFEIGQCAFRLGKLFAGEAERAGTLAERLEFFELFDRCGFAVRMSVALELRLRREARAEARDEANDRFAERDAPERDQAERDPVESDAESCAETEREREREREPVSLPVLLKSLDAVAAVASALPGPEPAELPTLRELLAKVKAGMGPSPGPGSPSKPPVGGSLRTRLAASVTAPAFSAPPHLPGRRGALAFRRATGPPR